jgi:hypothetical protein
VSKPQPGASKAPAPKRRSGPSGPSGKSRQASVLVRGPHWMIDLIDDAAERSNSGRRSDWLRSALIIQAAEELGLDPVAALSGQRKPAESTGGR